MADDSIKTRESTPPPRGLDNGPNFGANSPEPCQATTDPNFQETNASQPQAEVPVVVQLRDKLTDLVQLLGSSGVLLSQTQSQPNLVLGSGQPVSRGAELHMPCHSRNINPSTAETSASFCIQYPGKARDFHYNPGVDQEDDRISLMAPDNNDLDGATNEEPPYASVPSMVTESERDTGSKASSFQARAAADLDSLLGKTKAQSTGQKRPSNNDGVSIQSKKSKTGENETATPDLQVDEEILQEFDEGRPRVKKQGPPILGNLTARINRYWKTESDNQTTVNFLKNQYLTPENCEELLIPPVNRELYVKLHPYHKRQDKKLTDIQETLLCATTAVANIANLVLEADKQSRMVDTKAIVTHALNATTLMGNIHSKLNNKRKELIGKTLPADIKEVCSAQREVTTQLFGDDLGKAVREAKELNKLSNDLSPGYRPPRKPAFSKTPAPKPHKWVPDGQYSGGYGAGGQYSVGHNSNQTTNRKQGFHQRRRPNRGR